MGLISGVLFFSELSVLYENVRIAPDTWYNANCVDDNL